MEIMACSRVGHLSRVSNDVYSRFIDFDNNRKRLAEVWVDGQYRDFFYFYNPDIKQANAGNITDRLAIRKRLNCKSFGWYMKNVFPWSSLPNEHRNFYGQVGKGRVSA